MMFWKMKNILRNEDIAQLVKDEDIKQLMEIYLKDIWTETDRT